MKIIYIEINKQYTARIMAHYWHCVVGNQPLPANIAVS